jgi:hypothetical protein
MASALPPRRDALPAGSLISRCASRWSYHDALDRIPPAYLPHLSKWRLNEKAFAQFLRTLFRQDWVVYSKPPFGGPKHVLQYLARYTHRVAISNHRIVDVTDTHVAFRWKDYAHHSRRRLMTLTHEEFLRRFLQHVLPKGFPRIRYFGFLANRRRGQLLPLCRTLLGKSPQVRQTPTAPVVPSIEHATWQCPRCQGSMQILERLTALQILSEECSQVYLIDSS